MTEADTSLGDWLQTIDEGDRADLRCEAVDRVSSFLELWPPLKPQWRPDARAECGADLLDERIHLAGKVDLSVGFAEGMRAGKVLIDLKTGGFSPHPPRRPALLRADRDDQARRAAPPGRHPLPRHAASSFPKTSPRRRSRPRRGGSPTASAAGSSCGGPTRCPSSNRGRRAAGVPCLDAAIRGGRTWPPTPEALARSTQVVRRTRTGRLAVRAAHRTTALRVKTRDAGARARAEDRRRAAALPDPARRRRRRVGPLRAHARAGSHGSTTRCTAAGSASSGRASRRSRRTAARCSSPTTRAPSRPTRRRSCTASRPSCSRPVYGLAEYIFRSVPVVGTLWSRVGGVAAHPDNAYRLLREQQQLVLVFPEGTQGHGEDLQRALPAAPVRPRRVRRDRHAGRRAGRADRRGRRRGVDADRVQDPAARQGARRAVRAGHREHARCSARSALVGVLPGQVQAPGARPDLTSTCRRTSRATRAARSWTSPRRSARRSRTRCTTCCAAPAIGLVRLIDGSTRPRHRPRHVLGRPGRAGARASTTTSTSSSGSTARSRRSSSSAPSTSAATRTTRSCRAS